MAAVFDLRSANTSGVVDLDGDNIITHHEIRAAHYKKLADSHVVHSQVVHDVEYSKRYSAFQLKALAKLRHSKRTLVYEDSKEAESKRVAAAKRKNKPQPMSPWEAAELSDIPAMTKFINAGFNPYFHEKGGKGRTVLHIAVWRSHVDLAEYLIEHVRSVGGEQAVSDYVNIVDTAYNMVTPLLEAARTEVGDVNTRLAMVKLLTSNGASVTHADSHGDNCLHWSTRRSCLPIVSFLIKGTDAAVLAGSADNFKLRKPVDVAIHVNDRQWRETAECVRDEENSALCTTCGVQHKSRWGLCTWV